MRVTALVVSFLLIAGCNAQPQQKEEVSLIPEEPPKEIRLAYAFEMQKPAGKPELVGQTSRFHSGDGFRLRVQPDFPAYVYLYNRTVGDTKFVRLFPVKSGEKPAPLAAGKENLLPGGDTWMRFDSTAGEEQFILVAATDPVKALEQFGSSGYANQMETLLAQLERELHPESSRRFEDGMWVRLIASHRKPVAMMARLPLRHE